MMFRLNTGVEVVMEPHLDWGLWVHYDCRYTPALIVGKETYEQLLYYMTVAPQQFETDPGPLDAKVD